MGWVSWDFLKKQRMVIIASEGVFHGESGCSSADFAGAYLRCLSRCTKGNTQAPPPGFGGSVGRPLPISGGMGWQGEAAGSQGLAVAVHRPGPEGLIDQKAPGPGTKHQ